MIAVMGRCAKMHDAPLKMMIKTIRQQMMISFMLNVFVASISSIRGVEKCGISNFGSVTAAG
jgi:hypothetical protein